MRQALAASSNVATVRLANMVGLDRVIEQAKRCRPQRSPSAAFRPSCSAPLKRRRSSSRLRMRRSRHLANGRWPRLVTRVLDANGQVLWQQRPLAEGCARPIRRLRGERDVEGCDRFRDGQASARDRISRRRRGEDRHIERLGRFLVRWLYAADRRNDLDRLRSTENDRHRRRKWSDRGADLGTNHEALRRSGSGLEGSCQGLRTSRHPSRSVKRAGSVEKNVR